MAVRQAVSTDPQLLEGLRQTRAPARPVTLDPAIEFRAANQDFSGKAKTRQGFDRRSDEAGSAKGGKRARRWLKGVL
jgi:hypothetical protein